MEGVVVEKGAVDILLDWGEHRCRILTGLFEQHLVVHRMLQHKVMRLGRQHEQVPEILLL